MTGRERQAGVAPGFFVAGVLDLFRPGKRYSSKPFSTFGPTVFRGVLWWLWEIPLVVCSMFAAGAFVLTGGRY